MAVSDVSQKYELEPSKPIPLQTKHRLSLAPWVTPSTSNLIKIRATLTNNYTKRRELINEKIDKKDLRIRDGKLLIRQDNKWVVYEDPKEAND